MEFVNLTPHDIVFQHQDGSRVTFPKPEAGKDARVDTLPVAREDLGEIDGMMVAPYPVYGEVTNLPDPCEGRVNIVSLIVLSQAKGRTDVVAPGTGPKDGVIRFPVDHPQKGQVQAVTRWVAAPAL